MRGRLAVFERAWIVAGVLAASAVTAASASAASPPPRPLDMWHRWVRSHANAPSFTFFSTVFGFAGPREVRIAGKRYEMGLTVFATPGGGSSEPPFASIDLQRAAPRSRPTAFQLHDYSFAPQSGTTFTFQKDTMDTSLDLGATIAPSQLTATYTPTSPIAKRRCTLITGGHGSLRQSRGTMTYSPFNIATPTSPFFGTLSTGPAQAAEAFDPGCRGSGIIFLAMPHVLAAAPLAASRAEPCAGRETVITESTTEQWVFEKVFGQRLTTQLVSTGTNPNTQPVVSDAHAIIAATPGYDLPRPFHNGRQASAVVSSVGDPFMSGGATFTSTRAPVASGGHTCQAGGKIHHFSSLRYPGRLAPNVNPLTAAFDTAPVAMTPRHATLTIRHYR